MLTISQNLSHQVRLKRLIADSSLLEFSARFFPKTLHQKQGFHFEEGMSESEICRQYLKEVYDLPDKAFLIESKSTNSGENAIFSLEILHSLDALRFYQESLIGQIIDFF